MGGFQFRCNPFLNVKEPECIQKWTLMKIDILLRAYQSTLGFYQKLAPLQEKMLKHIEREMNDIDESDKWKHQNGDDEPNTDDLDGPKFQ
jgi:hypothetical protein